MSLFQISQDAIRDVNETTFKDAKIHERQDLQRLLRDRIDVIDPDTLVIAEEFGDWEDSKRRIDLLGVDRQANLVVIELKRTEDGGHMDLQAIRYAAMVSTLTFDKAVEIYADYLAVTNSTLNARSSLLEFLEWDEPNDDLFNQDVRIVLVSAEFSKEVTTSVLWLLDREIDIRCIRLKPYMHNGSVLVHVQPIIPLPEAEDIMVRIREKSRRERIAKATGKDLTKYDVTIAGKTEERLAKRQAILRIVKHFCASGVTPEQIASLLPWRSMPRLFQTANGKLNSAALNAHAFDPKRYFCDQDDLIYANGKTYAFTNQWGERTAEAITTLLEGFPDKGVSCKVSETD